MELSTVNVNNVMTKLIDKSDPQFFELSSEDPYIRHHYKVVDGNGKETIVDNWEDAAVLWWNKKAFLSHIEVLN